MHGYIILRDGTYKKFDSDNIKYKNRDIKSILIECWHPLFGTFYVAVKYKTYLQLKRIKQTKVTYRFLDGLAIDEYDEEHLFVKNKYWYNSISDLLAKMIEIYINENIFNDSFWVMDTFFQFIYDDINIRIKRKNKHKRSNVTYREFMGKLLKPIFNKDVLTLKSKMWRLDKLDKFDKTKGESLIQIYPNIYFRIDNKIFTNKKYELDHRIYELLVLDSYYANDAEEIKYEEINRRLVNDHIKKRSSLGRLLETYVSKYVIGRLENWYEYEAPTYDVKNKIRLKTKKNKWKKTKLSKFVRKYFVNIN